MSDDPGKSPTRDKPNVTFFKNGPLQIREPCKLFDGDTQQEIVPKKFPVYLCRCGGSQNKPFCDGAHNGMGFDGTCVPGADG